MLYQWVNASFKYIDILQRYYCIVSCRFFIHFRVSEFLPKLNGEEEVIRNSSDPVINVARIRRSIERTVYLYRIEELAVILKLIYLSLRVKIASPLTLTSRVRPS